MEGGVHLSLGLGPANGGVVVRQCEEDGLRYAATLTLPNRDLACHKYVQAGSQPMAGDVGSFAFFPKESEVIGADVQP